MDWIKQLNEVIEYIEENLAGEISYDQIGKIAGCSVYNFQRMFSYIADKPLSEYIRNRRLTLAAFDILNTPERIVDIAIKYGYVSQDAFTRAFKGYHGVLPSTVRNNTVRLKSCPKLSFQISIKGASQMNYQIEQFPAFKVTGIVHRVNTARAFEEIPPIWDNAWKDGTMDRLIGVMQQATHRPTGFLGICTGGQWGDSEQMDYILAATNYVEIPGATYITPPEGMQEFAYPAATWVIFEANGKLPEAVQKIYKEFYTEWLPNSGYQLADLPVIESYMEGERQEVWIALEKK